MITWVVGGNGLLGSAIRQHSGDSFSSATIPWPTPEAAAATLSDEVTRFRAESAGEPWAIVWAAGAATVSTPRDRAFAELESLRALLTAVRQTPPAGPGMVFLTSSAGGVYAGSANPPFDATTPPVPVSAYGELKLAQEQLAAALLAGSCPVAIGRVSNLYGAGQNLDKLQGLISHLALAAATSHPVNIFVSLDTIRDYVYVDDAARAVRSIVDAHVGRDAGLVTTSVIASGEPTTVGQLIRTVRQVTKRRIPVASGYHSSAASQVADLRLTPSDPSIARTPLPAGVRAVYLDILSRLQRKPLTA